jgi:hypothetical protein
MAGIETQRASQLAFHSADPATNPNKLADKPSKYPRKAPLPIQLPVLQTSYK